MDFCQKYDCDVRDAFEHYVTDNFWLRNNPYRMREILADIIRAYKGKDVRRTETEDSIELAMKIYQRNEDRISENEDTVEYRSMKALCK